MKGCVNSAPDIWADIPDPAGSGRRFSLRRLSEWIFPPHLQPLVISAKPWTAERHGRTDLYALRRRSHKTRITWTRMRRIETRWLPRARVIHPYPNIPNQLVA